MFPLLDEKEKRILTQCLSRGRRGIFRVRHRQRDKILNEYSIGTKKLQRIVWKLNFYARLYELEALEFNLV